MSSPLPLARVLPVRVLPGRPAAAMRLLQPAVISALFLLSFRPLVADPASTLRRLLPAVAAVQAAYAALCLPPAGSAAVLRKSRPGTRRGGVGVAAEPGPSRLLAVALSLAFCLLVTPFVHVGLVLFGAPFLDSVPHTLLTAAHTALLALLPLFYARGVDSRIWRLLASGAAPLDETSGGLVGALAGAWLGAIPIPLDWDRDWQAWPVTVVTGLWVGCLLGKVAGGTVAYGHRLGAPADEDEGVAERGTEKEE